MGAAAFWSFVGASSVLIGALIGGRVAVPTRTIGLVMGFGAGTLVSVVTYELVFDAFHLAGRLPTLLGLASGALLLWGSDWLLERFTGGEDPVVDATVSGPSLVAGALLDGVPESLAIGITLLGGEKVSIAIVAAVFIANIAESLAASVGLRQGGTPPARILAVWAGVLGACTIAGAAGYGILGGASNSTIAFIQAFAGGAILTMLANTMFPDAYRNGGREVGLVTVLGFVAGSGLVIASTG